MKKLPNTLLSKPIATLRKPAIIALVVVVLAVVLLRHRDNGAVDVVHASYGPAVQAVYATGTVEASVMMPIAARSSAKLMELHADENDQVTKGQVLAQLEDDDLRHTLDQLKVREDFARNELDRNTELLKRNIISKGIFDRYKSEWEAAHSATQAADAQINYLKLVAPADGKVIRRDGEIGQLIPANQPVFWISCCAPLRISAEVDEEDIALVQPDQKVLIRADAFPGQVFHGTVQSITPKGDPVARSYRVRINFAEETPLLIGMTAETNIIIHEKDQAMLLPASAVQQNTVWRVADGRLEQVPVTVGARGTERIEILTGIADTDDIVLKPDNMLRVGNTIRTSLVTGGS